MNRWLSIVLSLVIALQSLVVIGDTKQPHHPATPHYEYLHEGVVIDSATLEMEESATSLDHSQHNHTHFHVVLMDVATDMGLLAGDQGLSDYQASHTSVTPSSLFRPPIA
ncbi:hypothetical protein [Marinobacter sp. UBA2678]|uniref:hypothetical protein n=1 Tax=Marinobacter sp. UBA2678 TaxID=1946815 RepID=UPI000C0A64D8|nr:hypothetical protein [Marinobacter sp. UBA2678]MAM88613.1 hypothetical protein [Hahellaceae bacterium]|tara:strand:- start:12288 stop:12617 length:330 start_codon:yes stop_codon:yes gene_type:complete